MKDIEKRMTLAMAKFDALHHIWGDIQLSRDLRVRLYTVRVVSSHDNLIMQLKRS